ncbi:hypothetical protein GGR34_000769 [Microvirga flocculans]|uniref:Uncharacterized protein n=1 Tax=Microvirga flocculans TaxID=217168 RepID=A0A7W6IE22_9HYPH|nr:hypothetical protein [Microvirga flocculans]
MTIKIEKGIPIPNAHRERRYPWGDMEVGDSIFIPNTTSERIAPTAHDYGRRHKRKFSVRKVEGGVRVWRVE